MAVVREAAGLVVYGNVVLSLMNDQAIDVDRRLAGSIGSLAFAGLLDGGCSPEKSIDAEA